MQLQQQIHRGILLAGVLAGLQANMQVLRADDAAGTNAVKLPFTVYEDRGSANNHYIPAGWMGNAKATKMDDGWATNPHGGKTCLRFDYGDTTAWSGIVWQDPMNDWGSDSIKNKMIDAKIDSVKYGDIVVIDKNIGLDKFQNDILIKLWKKFGFKKIK